LQIASEFWHTKVFVKTYRERRTWAAVYRNFFRVWCVHFVCYQFLQVLAFTGWDWRFLSSCIVTHSWMKAFERICNWFMTAESAEPLNTTLSKVFTSQVSYVGVSTGVLCRGRVSIGMSCMHD
jgi:1,3-beta-glucan synthase